MAEPEITADVVSCLLREQVPHLAHLPVAAVDVDGWDNRTFRVGTEHSARLPSADGYVPGVLKEHRWLPVLRPHLPFPVPEPVALGAPGCGFPRPWSVNRWLPGETASSERVADLDAFARDVARFLRSLWSVDAHDGPAAGDHSFGRGGPLSVYDAEVRETLAVLPDDDVRAAAEQRWDAALASPYEDAPRWFHGDMAPSNLLVRQGRLAAVIDFGTCGVGDPACDLVLAWTFLDARSRRAFEDALDVDAGTWDRARGWALWKALLTLRDPEPVATARRYGWRVDAAEVVRAVVDDG